ncbi:PREDICTED: protein ROOT HAIR DEFECTIVE 3 homolog 2-like [Prunus mume]|uniref:Protein ROOT HAIR DEFECTIVE 3 homolog 2-like n=1 Tax=Prunus mume TaxID=102107 RepID=A0ABM1LLB4_PRUMU|nr:PREDICTED: protein ROOT HAIR DEFECTIVE 3 homolog 2-like [Prunus mume]
MAMKEDCCAMQLIDHNSEFNAAGFNRFTEKVKLADHGLSYAVVAIMGPQSSGKSTLMNHLFHTNFREMDAYQGRNQTTKGVWLAKCVGIQPFTIAMDLEGTDGSERGQDDIAFEKQSALFALAISDIVIINMWCHDIGRENASNKPLLRTIWDGVQKPQAHESTLLNDIFNVQVVALPNYESEEEIFKEEVGQLRQRFPSYTSQGGLASDRIPASAFSFSAQDIWNVIKENRDLDLPNHKVMVATVRCKEIAAEKFNQLMQNKDWLAWVEAAKTSPVPGFGEKLTSILNTYLSEYDKEAMYFDEGVRNERKEELQLKALESVHVTYTTMLGHLSSKVLEEFKVRLEKSLKEGSFDSSVSASCIVSSMREFDQGCKDATMQNANWDSSSIRKILVCDIDAHALRVHDVKLSELKDKCEKQLSTSLTKQVEAHLEDGIEDVWASIRSVLHHHTEEAVSMLSTEIVAFNVDNKSIAKMEQDLRACARNVVEKIVRDKTGSNFDAHETPVGNLFEIVFFYDRDNNPRAWTKKKVVRAATKDAYSASLKVLSVMAAICLDDGTPNNIEKSLFSSLMDETKAAKDPLGSSTWEGVSPKDTVITPVRCKSLWENFKLETRNHVTQATSARDTAKKHWLAKFAIALTAGVASAIVGAPIAEAL